MYAEVHQNLAWICCRVINNVVNKDVGFRINHAALCLDSFYCIIGCNNKLVSAIVAYSLSIDFPICKIGICAGKRYNITVVKYVCTIYTAFNRNSRIICNQLDRKGLYNSRIRKCFVFCDIGKILRSKACDIFLILHNRHCRCYCAFTFKDNLLRNQFCGVFCRVKELYGKYAVFSNLKLCPFHFIQQIIACHVSRIGNADGFLCACLAVCKDHRSIQVGIKRIGINILPHRILLNKSHGLAGPRVVEPAVIKVDIGRIPVFIIGKVHGNVIGLNAFNIPPCTCLGGCNIRFVCFQRYRDRLLICTVIKDNGVIFSFFNLELADIAFCCRGIYTGPSHVFFRFAVVSVRFDSTPICCCVVKRNCNCFYRRLCRLRLCRLGFCWLGLGRLGFCWLGLGRLGFCWLGLGRIYLGIRHIVHPACSVIIFPVKCVGCCPRRDCNDLLNPLTAVICLELQCIKATVRCSIHCKFCLINRLAVYCLVCVGHINLCPKLHTSLRVSLYCVTCIPPGLTWRIIYYNSIFRFCRLRFCRLRFCRLGFCRLGFCRLGFCRLGFCRLGLCRLGLCRLGFCRLGLCRLGFCRICCYRCIHIPCTAPGRATAAEVCIKVFPFFQHNVYRLLLLGSPGTFINKKKTFLSCHRLLWESIGIDVALYQLHFFKCFRQSKCPSIHIYFGPSGIRIIKINGLRAVHHWGISSALIKIVP